MATYTDKQLERLWEEFGYASFDECDDMDFVLAENWFIFEAGTERDEIWHWFDEHHSKGVYALMFPDEQ